jgi:hypothetical protein
MVVLAAIVLVVAGIIYKHFRFSGLIKYINEQDLLLRPGKRQLVKCFRHFAEYRDDIRRCRFYDNRVDYGHWGCCGWFTLFGEIRGLVLRSRF